MMQSLPRLPRVNKRLITCLHDGTHGAAHDRSLNILCQREQHSSSSPKIGPDSTRDPVVGTMLRQTQAVEAAAAGFFKGQQLVNARQRTDFSFYSDQERDAFQQASQLLPKNRARPSVLQGALRIGGLGAGLLAGLAPRSIQLAVWGAVGETLTEHYNDKLRELREHTLDEEGTVQQDRAKQVHDVREAMRQLRDLDRTPHDAPPAPDIMILQHPEKLREIGIPGLLSVLTKTAGRAALKLSAKL